MQFTPTQQRAAAWLGIFAVCVWVLVGLGPVLMPFVVGAGLAYALSPLVGGLHRVLGGYLPRLVCVLAVECVFLLVALALLTLLVPILLKELPLLREQLPLQLQRLDAWLAPMLQHWGVQTRLDVASFKTFLMQHFDGSMDQVVTTLLSSLRMGGSMALTLIGNAVLIPVVLFYLLADWDRFVALLREWVPLRWRAPVDGFMIEADAVLGQYLRGQISVMLALAIYYSLALRLCGLELALPIGVFTGLAIFIPYLGFGLGLLLALLAAVLQFEPLQALGVVALVYGAGQVLESFVLTPRWVGERIGLHPLAVIFALLAFGQLLGFVGVLVALPASAVLLVALRRLKQQYMASPLYR
jgi:predicted PurR-regulated permease PerM